MPGIIDQQIAKYESAARGPKNVGGQATDTQKKQAADTSIGNVRANITRKTVDDPISMSVSGSPGSGSSSALRPSLEGYMHAPSTLIAGNNAGYSNPSRQNARYKTKGIGVSKPADALSGFAPQRSNIKDYRNVGFANNSIKKLNSIIKKRLF